uniref:CRAL-TRIO domain-containing protein n=1 Tax=Emiliania huxleyi TaxID=2903 RepID=A0A7S3S9L7_EMIHU
MFRVLDLAGVSLTPNPFRSSDVKKGEGLVKAAGKEVRDAYPTTTYKNCLINAPAASIAGRLPRAACGAVLRRPTSLGSPASRRSSPGRASSSPQTSTSGTRTAAGACPSTMRDPWSAEPEAPARDCGGPFAFAFLGSARASVGRTAPQRTAEPVLRYNLR